MNFYFLPFRKKYRQKLAAKWGGILYIKIAKNNYCFAFSKDAILHIVNHLYFYKILVGNSRARSELTISKKNEGELELWTTYNVDETTQSWKYLSRFGHL